MNTHLLSDELILPDWILANDALIRLTAMGQDVSVTKASLAESLRDGRVVARVDRVWISDEPDLGRSWRLPQDDVQQNIEVPVSYWRTDLNVINDRAQWRWTVSKFFYTLRASPVRRRMFTGVSFRLSDLNALYPGRLAPPEKIAKSGRKVEHHRRDAGWLTVIAIANDGMLHKQSFPRQGDLEAEMFTRLGQTDSVQVGKNQITEIASQVFKRLIDRPTG